MNISQLLAKLEIARLKYQKRDWDSARDLCEDLLSAVAPTNGDDNIDALLVFGVANTILANVYGRKRRIQDSIDCAMSATQVFDGPLRSDKRAIADCARAHLSLAMSFRFQRELVPALSHAIDALGRAKELFDDTESILLKARIHGEISVIYKYDHEYENALQHALLNLELLYSLEEHVRPKKDLADAHLTAANIANETGDHEAEVFHRNISQQLFGRDDLFGKADVAAFEKAQIKVHLAISRNRQGDARGAAEHFGAAVGLMSAPEFASDADLAQRKAKTLATYGVTLKQLGDAENARKQLEAASAIWQRPPLFGRKELLPERAQTLGLLANLLREQQQLMDARERFRETLEVMTMPCFDSFLDQAPYKAKTLATYGATLTDLGDDAEARTQLEAAAELWRRPALAEREEFLPDRVRTLIALVVSCRKLGDLEAARDRFSEALEVMAAPAFDENPELTQQKAKTLATYGATLTDLGDDAEARTQLEAAAELWRRPALAEREEFLPDRALTNGQLAKVLHRNGHLMDALTAAQEEVRILEKLSEGADDDPDLMAQLARANGARAGILADTNDLEAAKAAAREEVRILEKLTGDANGKPEPMARLARASGALAGILADTNDLEGAEAAAREQVRILEKLTKDADGKPDLMTQLARANGALAGILANTDDLEGAEAAAREEVRILEKLGEDADDDPDLMAQLARAYGALAGILANTDDLEGAEAAAREEVRILDKLSEDTDGKPDLMAQLARAKSHLSRMKALQSDFSDAKEEGLGAIDHWKAALKLAPVHAHAEYSEGLSDALYGYAAILIAKAELSDAEQAVRDGLAILQAPPLSEKPQLDTKRAGAMTLLARILRNSGDLTPAEKAVREALSILKAPDHQSSFGFHLQSAKAEESLATILRSRNVSDDYGDAASALERALAHLNAEPTRKLRRLDPYRVKLLGRLGRIHQLRRRAPDSIDALQRMLYLLEIDTEGLAGRSEFDSLRFEAHLALGRVYCDLLGQLGHAIEYFDNAESYLDRMAGGSWIGNAQRRSRLYASAATVMSQRRDPDNWARKCARELSELIELAPRHFNGIWDAIRLHVKQFQSRWLSYALQEGQPVTVLQILLSIQGPDLISAVLDDFEAADLPGDEAEGVTFSGAEWDALPPRRQFVLIRRKLRHLAEELFDTSELPGAGEDQEVESDFEDLAEVGSIGSVGGSIEKASKLQQTYDAFFSKMQSIRNAISSDPEIEKVVSPIDHVTVASLQKVLLDGEVLVTVFPRLPVTKSDLELETSHMLVIPKSGQARIVNCPPPGGGVPSASAIVDYFERFDTEMEGMRGGRHPRSADGAIASEVMDPREPDHDQTIDRRPASFWHEFDDLISTMIWEPLQQIGILRQARRVTFTTVDLFHILPLRSVSAYDVKNGLEVRHANSLPIFVISRRLLAGGATPRIEDSDVSRLAPQLRPAMAIGLASDQFQDDIPFAKREMAITHQLWSERKKSEQGLHIFQGNTIPLAKPRQVERFDFCHVACHGSVGKSSPPRPTLYMEGDFTEKDIVRPPGAKSWLLTSCVVGRGYDRLIDGVPQGIVSAALRTGAHTVVAFLSPVPDEIGLLTGLTITAAMVRPRDPLPLGLAADHARRVLDPIHPEDDPELMRLVAEALATQRAEDYANALAGGCPPTELGKDVAEVDRRWTDFHGLAEELAAREASPSAAELAPILARHIHPQIPAETPEDRLRLGVLQHALVVFEGYPQG